MTSFAQFGNDLYTGRRSIDFVGRQKLWYAVSAVMLVLAAIGLFGRHLNLGLEFRGGSEFRVASVTNMDNFEVRAKAAIGTQNTGSDVVVTRINTNTVRVQTEKFDNTQANGAETALAKEFNVPESTISFSTVGASWGASVSQKALQALIVFLILVSLVLAAYFRTWTMSLAALIALAHDLVITVGIYALAGFEVTPASVIGFLTILGYSLYDTVVVFDKVRENTQAAIGSGRMSYSQAANEAVNQTLVRSINTSAVALLPVGSILFIGFFLLGPGTLLDLSLALFIGIAVGTYSSIFIATPVLADLREREPAMQKLKKQAERYQATKGRQVSEAAAFEELHHDGGVQDTVPVPAAGGTTAGGRTLHPYVQTGPRNQPRRPPKSKR
ncbi:MAG: protein translocase subunit SecF [Dermatophilaceae bacterium]